MANADHDALITQLSELTGLEPHVASQYLSSNQWNVEAAAAEYYMSLEEGSDEDNETESGGSQQGTGRPGGRRLDGTYQTQPTTTRSGNVASSSSQPAQKKKIATLGDLSSGSQGSHGHDDEDESDEEENRNLYAGGEKSALAVENPEDIKKKIIQKAMKGAQARQNEPAKAAPSRFRGTARTLGGDDAPSRVIEDLSTETQPREEVERILHFWANGFSVDDGPLYDTNDPRNARLLNTIKSGRAPLELLNVGQHQEVSVRLVEHEGPYVAPKKTYKPFQSGGQRLGSPTPGISTSSASQANTASSASTSTSTGTSAPAVSLDDSQPTISLQIRLGDGTRLVSRFNPSHTVGDVYSFVNSSSASSQGRAWVLMTTFPSKELSDKSVALGDMAELKKGGVVMQKWT